LRLLSYTSNIVTYYARLSMRAIGKNAIVRNRNLAPSNKLRMHRTQRVMKASMNPLQ
jgi:hypothetical protein